MLSLAATVCATALLLLLQPAQSQPTADELTFAKLRDVWNTTGQWGLAFATGNKKTGVYTPVNCSDPTLGACTATNPPMTQDSGDQLKVTYTMKAGRGPNGEHLTYQGMDPTHFQIRVCYTLNSSVDRAWRKKNKPYPRLTQNCPRTVATIPFVGSRLKPDNVSNSGVVYWDLDQEDEIPKSTWFLMIWVWCGDSQVCAFQSTEGRPDLTPQVSGNFIETDSEMGITKGMIVAAAICSIIGPAFFITFWISDVFHYRKTGKPIRLF